MEMRRRTMSLASAALLAQAACASTSYAPRPDGRIATTLEDGRPMLVKDGRSYPAGGAALKELVAGNPVAEEHARSYTTSMRFGIAEQLIGFGALIAGAVIVAPRQDDMGMDIPVSDGRQFAGSALGIGGLALFVVSGFHLASSQAHFQDAINVYNDGVPPRWAPPPGWQPTSPVPLPGPPPPGAPPSRPAPPPAPQAYPPPPAPAN
jgi:hypothetical protein